jgi:hypothetical protein
LIPFPAGVSRFKEHLSTIMLLLHAVLFRIGHESAILKPNKDRRFMPKKLNNEILAAAIEGFEAQKKRIDAQIAEVRQLMTGGSAEPAATPEPARTRRKMSAAARKRIAEAQRKRWAESKKESGAAPQVAKSAVQKPKRKLSAAGRERIIEATKRRWALVRAGAAKAAK